MQGTEAAWEPGCCHADPGSLVRLMLVILLVPLAGSLRGDFLCTPGAKTGQE